MLEKDNSNLATQAQLIYDRGLHYGDGVFETIAVKNSKAEYLEQHLNRLQHSCVRLKINNVAFSDIKSDVQHQAKNLIKGILKIIITRGVGGRGYAIPKNNKPTILLLDYPWPNFNNNYWNNGVTIKKCALELADQPALAGIKHLNRLENIIAKMELDNSNYQEGLLCDARQNVIEATSSNVFVVLNNKLLTPELNKNGVAGILRDQVIHIARSNKLEIEISELPYTRLLKADEIFLTNSIIGIWPVAKFNERMYTNFPITRKIMTLLNIDYHE